MTEEQRKQDREKEEARNHPPGPYGWYPPEEDEIDLAELVGVIFRRKWLIIGLIVIVGLAAVAYTLRQPEKYSASTMIEIGQVYTGDGFRKVESSTSIKNRVTSLGEAVKGNMKKDLPEKDVQEALHFSLKEDLEIEVPKDGTMVTMSLEAPKSSMARPFLRNVTQALIEDHDRIFNQERTSLANQIQSDQIRMNTVETAIDTTRRNYATKKLDLQSILERLDIQDQELSNELQQLQRQFANQMQVKENAIQQLTNKMNEANRTFQENLQKKENQIQEQQHAIGNIKTQIEVIQQEISLLDQERDDLAKRITKNEERYNQLLDSKWEANKKAAGAEAISLMLYSSEIQHLQNYLDQLRQRLLFDIPEQKSKHRARITELNSKIQNVEAEIRLIQTQKEQLKERKTEQLQNLLAQQELERIKLDQFTEELKEQTQTLEGKKQELQINKKERRLELEQLDQELQDKVQNLQADQKQLQIKIDESQSKLDNMITTQVLVAPQFSENPVGSNLKRNAALGLVVGLFLGIFGAFVLEFWRKNRDKIVQKGAHREEA